MTSVMFFDRQSLATARASAGFSGWRNTTPQSCGGKAAMAGNGSGRRTASENSQSTGSRDLRRCFTARAQLSNP